MNALIFKNCIHISVLYALFQIQYIVSFCTPSEIMGGILFSAKMLFASALVFVQEPIGRFNQVCLDLKFLFGNLNIFSDLDLIVKVIV